MSDMKELSLTPFESLIFNAAFYEFGWSCDWPLRFLFRSSLYRVAITMFVDQALFMLTGNLDADL